MSEPPERNDALIQRFYAAFDRRDGDAMAAWYAPGARFSDPVFPDLRGEQPGRDRERVSSVVNVSRCETFATLSPLRWPDAP